MNVNNSNSEDELDIKELLLVIWKGKKLIVRITAIITLATLFYALMLTNYYKSEALLVSRDSSQNQSLLSQYSGVASMVGVNLSTSGGGSGDEVIEIIKSRKFVRHLLTHENILPSIMAAKGFDTSTKELLFDKNIYDPATKKWSGSFNGGKKPSYLEAHNVYKDYIISVSMSSKTGFILISVEHISPIFAKEFLELIIKEVNMLLRKRDMEESDQALQYLKSELSKTSLVEIKGSINALIESQLEKQMMAQINEDYFLIAIEPPFISERKSKPNRGIIMVTGVIIGFIISLFIVVLRHYYFSDRKIMEINPKS